MASEPTSRQLVVFSIGEEEYALGIEQVHEIIRYVEPRPVSSSDPAVRGVISLRGRILSVLDLSARLGVARSDQKLENTRIVIVDHGHEMTGLMVDVVVEVITVEEAAITDAPVRGGEDIAAVARVEDRLLVMLDPDAIAGTREQPADDQTEAVA